MPASYSLLEHGDSNAVVALGSAGRRTVNDLHYDTETVRRYLERISHKQAIVVVCQDRYVQTLSMLAAWQLGRAVTLPANTHPTNLDAWAGSDTGVVLHDTTYASGVHVPAILDAPRIENPPLRPLSPEQVLVRIHTSGSTGTPQAHDKTAQQLFDEIDLHIQLFSLSARDCLVSTVPCHHIYGLLFGILLPLRAAMPVERSIPLHATTVASRIDALGATTLVSTPVHLESLAASDANGAGSLGRVFCSGAPLSSQTVDQFCARYHVHITELLGSTETGGIAWRMREAKEQSPPAWQTLPGLTVSTDDHGHLLLESPFLSPTGTQPASCADRVQLVDSRHFHHLGRSDDVVKIGGKRFSILEIEQHIRNLSGVEDVALLIIQTERGRGTELWAAIAATNTTAHGLKKALADCIDPVAMPRRLRVVQALPRDTTGKLPKARLRRLFEHG
jgi:acyl-coenzyme A synthetase/AMP-(fatty) acid ligase